MLSFDDKTAATLEAMYLTPDVVAQRAQTIALLAPQPGEHGLDIGVGPGLLAYDLSAMVGESGRLVGIDIAPAMLTMARTRTANLPQTEILEGRADRLDFPPESFDFAVSVQVHEYVAEVDTSLRALHRILKPGGRFVILDTDWRSLVWHTQDQDRMDRVLACWDRHLADPHLPATLGGRLGRAGFQTLAVEAIPMLAPTWQPHSYAAGIMQAIRRFVLDNGEKDGLDRATVEAWYQEQMQFAERGSFFFSVNRYAFLALKR